jgi:hypothetical protein
MVHLVIYVGQYVHSSASHAYNGEENESRLKCGVIVVGVVRGLITALIGAESFLC